MTLYNVIFATISALFTALLTLVAYFGKKYFDSIESKLLKQSLEISKLKDKVNAVEIVVNSTEMLSQRISSHIEVRSQSEFKEIQEDIKGMREVVLNRILPHADTLKEYHGKVIILEEDLKNQQERMDKIIKALSVLIKKERPSERP